MEMFRQGDVLVVKLSDDPATMDMEGAKPIDREGGRIVLAHGEVTGHAHAISVKPATFWEMPSGDRILKVHSTGAVLRHEEHAPIKLGKGAYRVIRQREYTPEEIRYVAD